MNKQVNNDPLERLVAQMRDVEIGVVPEVRVSGSEDPLERLGAWMVAGRDLSSDLGGEEIGGVLGELLGRIRAAQVIEPAGETGLRAADANDPRVTIARWIADECAAVGRVPGIVALRAVEGGFVEGGAESGMGEPGVEAAVGRAVLSMIGEVALDAGARKKAVELLAVAMDEPSPQALQAVLRVLIGGE